MREGLLCFGAFKLPVTYTRTRYGQDRNPGLIAFFHARFEHNDDRQARTGRTRGRGWGRIRKRTPMHTSSVRATTAAAAGATAAGGIKMRAASMRPRPLVSVSWVSLLYRPGPPPRIRRAPLKRGLRQPRFCPPGCPFARPRPSVAADATL